MTSDQAREIAEDLYEDRRDKLGYPEFAHIQAVALGAYQLVGKELKEDAEVVGWLHDAVEDGLLSLRELYHDLTGVQFEALLMITRDGRQTYMNYVRMLRDYPGAVGEILRAVKKADLFHNVKRPCPPEMQGMREPGGRYYRALDILGVNADQILEEALEGGH